MLLPILAIIGGIALLAWSADRFVVGAATFAHNLGMSTLMVGLTIVSIGTSAPEILVSSIAAFMGASGLAVGNALGSNIANIALVLGVTALLVPIPVNSQLPKKELPILLIATFATLIILFDLELSRFDGILLLAGLVIALGVIIHLNIPRNSVAEVEEELETEIDNEMSTGKAIGMLLFGLVLLIASSRVLVWGATELALSFGISHLVIGLTIVAIGTSLPELAASVASALKGHHDMVVGNIIGSNLFNLLAVMSMPAIIQPFAFGQEVLERDYLAMGSLTLLLAVFCLLKKRGGTAAIGRGKGLLLSSLYIGYLYWLYLSH